MSKRGSMDHPLGIPPPDEWWESQGGRADYRQFREWQESTRNKPKQGKFKQIAGYYADLDLHLRSMLEANTGRLLMFLGYQIWREKGSVPPFGGNWVAYEWRKYRLIYKQGKADERPLFYVPDWHLWTDGGMTFWESKGEMNQRSKRLLRHFEEQVGPVVLITADDLDARRAEALFAARRQGPMILEIPHWNEGPVEKGDKR